LGILFHFIISEHNIISVELAQVLQYLLGLCETDPCKNFRAFLDITTKEAPLIGA
jgi:hypothetical protein